MVRIKFTAHPIVPVVSSEIESMALDEALAIPDTTRLPLTISGA
jgi:hypothetical protein